MTVYFHGSFGLNREYMAGVLQGALAKPKISDKELAKPFGYGAPFSQRYRSWLHKTGITELGLPLDPDNLTHLFKKFGAEAGYPKLRLHDLRHFHAYALAVSGAHPKVIQYQLGHASAAFTLQVYTHVDASLQAASVERTSGLAG